MSDSESNPFHFQPAADETRPASPPRRTTLTDLVLWLLPSSVCQMVLFLSLLQSSPTWRAIAGQWAFAQMIFFILSLVVSLVIISRGRISSLMVMRMVKLLIALAWIGAVLVTDLFSAARLGAGIRALPAVAAFWAALNVIFLVIDFGRLRTHRRYLAERYDRIQSDAIEQFNAEHGGTSE